METRAKLAGMELQESAGRPANVSKGTKDYGKEVAERFKKKQAKILKANKENG